MGGGSSNASAYTYIETSASSFIPGANVTGNVKILAEKPIQAGQMTILLSCISEVKWSTKQPRSTGRRYGRSRGGRRAKIYYDKRVIFTIKYPIWNFQGQLPQGQFTLPFSIQLPTDIPPSFDSKSGMDEQLTITWGARIRGFGKNEYTFEAVIDGSNEVQPQKTIVWVSRLPKPNEAIVPITTEANIKVTSCCCFKAGNVELRSTTSRNVVMANEVVAINSKINNIKNKFTVNKITSTLFRRLRLKIPKRPEGGLFLRTGTGVVSDDCICESHSVDIKPGQSDPLEVAMRLNLTQFQILWMVPSIASEMIDCEYFMKVTLDFDNFWGCGIYSIYLPIEICNGMVAINTSFSPPPQIGVAWNPSMLATAPVAVEGYADQPYQGRGNPSLDMTTFDHNTARGDNEDLKKVVPKS